MGTSKQHALLGATAGLAVYGLYVLITKKDFEWSKTIFCTATGFVCGLLPDLIEPATSPSHRKFAHSVLVLCGMSIGKVAIIESKLLSPEKKLYLSCAVASYGSHLLLDSSTPKGLPMM